MQEPFDRLFDPLCHRVREVLAGHPECHGVDHTLRVWRNAKLILAAEKADHAVVEYAAWLHDIGRVAEFADAGKSCHATIGSAMVPELLASLGIEDPSFIAQVSECVRTHRYRARDNQVPVSIEAKIIYDADKLDSLGAIGIGRAFHFAGRLGARVHNSEADALAGESYGREDSAYREYLVKLRHIHSRLLTREGQRLGRRRHEFMVGFFRELALETGVE